MISKKINEMKRKIRSLFCFKQEQKTLFVYNPYSGIPVAYTVLEGTSQEGIQLTSDWAYKFNPWTGKLLTFNEIANDPYLRDYDIDAIVIQNGVLDPERLLKEYKAKQEIDDWKTF